MSRNAPIDDSVAKVKVCSGHSRPVQHIAYSNIVDGSYWFVSSCLDGKPHLRNGETGDWVGTFEGHKGAVWMSCFNNAATQIATGSGDYSAKLWNALDGTDLHTWPHEHCVKSVDWYDAQGVSKILTGCMDRRVLLFDVNHPTADPFIMEGHTALIKTALFSSTSDAAFSASADNTLKRWDLRILQPSHSVDIPDLTCVEYNRATDLLVVASKTAVSIYDPNDLNLLRSYPCAEEVECAAMSPNGELFALGSKLKVKEYDRQSGNELQVHRGHHGPVFTVRYAPDSSAYASGSEDGMVRIWPNAHIIKQTKEGSAPQQFQRNIISYNTQCPCDTSMCPTFKVFVVGACGVK